MGRMLIQSAIDLNLNIYVLDPDANAPCKPLALEFINGSLTDFDSVYNFGKDKDLLTIEIENVNVDALEKLEQEGVKVFPQAEVIRTIQDKRRQKQFYKEKGIPTSEFILIDSKEQIQDHLAFLPAFQKLGRSGYDGRGVQRIANASQLNKALEGEGLLEKAVDFEKEISVIVARNQDGEVTSYPVVEMVFHPEHNLVEYLFAPAEISKELESQAREIALKIILELKMVGLLAVEMFVTKKGEILVNEIAPRPHNSGHHTIKANFTSQYEQHLRAILNLPLGSSGIVVPSALVNLLGEDGCDGAAKYDGVEEILKVEGVYLHLYGKKFTKPYRKMGHVTILEKDMKELKSKAEFVKRTLKVIA